MEGFQVLVLQAQWVFIALKMSYQLWPPSEFPGPGRTAPSSNISSKKVPALNLLSLEFSVQG